MNAIKQEIKPLQDQLWQLSTEYTQADLDKVLENNPNLTSNVLESRKSHTFNEHREYLKKSLKAFQLCCAFLSLCKKSTKASLVYTNTNLLKHRLQHFIGNDNYIPAGAIVAAADHLGIKYNADVTDNPCVCLYIKSELPITQEMEFIAREL